jgi:monoamine oxidase
MSISLFARLAHRHNPVSPAERRRFMQQSLAVGAGLLLSDLPAAWAKARAASAGKRVVVVGGGFAGLACAYELKMAGHDVTLIEATNRVGGRVLSFNAENKNEFVPGRNIEGGGELIGSNHPLWVAYAEKFGLSFLDVHESEMNYPIVLGGKIISGEESAAIYEEMDAAFALMNADAEPIDADAPWNSPNAAALDKRSIADWLKGIEARDIVKQAIDAQIAGDNGVDDDKASYLGMLACVKGGGLEKYWSDSEVYRCKGGNQQLAARLAKELGDRVITRLSVRTVDIKSDKVIVTCADSRTLECDEVVIATAPTVWQRIEFKQGLPAGLDAAKVQMGINTKFFSHVKRRYWQDNNQDPVSLAEGLDYSWTWDGTDAQDTPADAKEGDNPNPPEHPACLTAFAGGKPAERARARSTEDRKKAYAEQLEKVYAGYAANLVDTRFMDWPGMPFVGGGYSFPAPGQVTTAGPLLNKSHNGGRLHFASEACCYKFVGYMEGALQAGAAVAKRING